MNVFVTGHRGYVGSLLVLQLKAAGYQVTGCDLCLYEQSVWSQTVLPDKELRLDIRDLTSAHLEGFDAVCHLAALSNDPMGQIDEALTLSINRDASIRLATLAKSAGVPRFLFASSCSIYGKQEGGALNEEAPLLPQSVYARSKIEAEEGMLSLASPTFSPVCLRFATAYGLSPMLRLDLVANDLLASAFTTGEIRLMSDGTAHRPLIHAKDMARAFLACLEAPRETVHAEAINIGANEENYQVREIAKMVFSLLPQSKIVFSGSAGADPRNYRVDFSKLARLLPAFRLSYTLQTGLEELHRDFCQRPLTHKEVGEQTFVRLVVLNKNSWGNFCVKVPENRRS